MDAENTTSPQESTSPAVQPQSTQTNQFLIPGAIVFGFGLIAAAIFFSGTFASPATQQKIQIADDDTTDAVTGEMNPVDENDHILGNPNAPIMIVEYSDFDCPFCKNFHETMNLVMDTYGGDGQVAWVYRHFPLEQLHPSAPYIAVASECVAELGGNEAFWKFADLVFGERSTNQPTNTARLGEFARTSGVNETAYNECVESGRTQTLVEEDFNDGLRVGAKGTPHSIVLVGGQQFVINGAQPFEYVSQAIETLLEQIEG